MKFSSPIEELPVSEAYKKKLKRLGINKVSDLLFHFPHRYEDRSRVLKIKDLKVGEPSCLQVRVLEIQNSITPRRRMKLTEALVSDETGSVKVVWFNQPYLAKALKKGDRLSLTGKLVVGGKEVYFSNPGYEKIGPKEDLIHAGRIVPIYPETVGLSSKMLRWLTSSLLERFQEKMPETLPEEVIKEKKLFSLGRALQEIHFPQNLETAEKAKRRFQFENILLVQLFVLREKIKLAREKAVAVPVSENLLKRFTASLPFKLTDAQKRAGWQIIKDLEKPRPMNRLLEGDVGSGKTVVAALAALEVMKAGYQVAFMAPTEILAKQHFQEVAKLLEEFKVNIGLLTGKEDKFISKKLKRQVIEISREKILEKTLSGELDLLIGTHALIQDKVKFGNLALVILDEQHRFGVEQRARLIKQPDEKSRNIPHLLSMTATPIPRTLALTLYGDLDLSLIDEMPKGRKKIITKIIEPEDREEAYEFLRKEIEKGRQAFVICPRIEEEGRQEMRAVKREYQKLSEEVFPELRVAMLHGKMATKEKERIMQAFKNRKTDILVSTSVVEVGIDVPNAAVMIIEGTERFGLAQLYQFRGRVGRAEHQSYCFLFTDSPSRTTRQRLRAVLKAESGFELAEKDLAIRGPGDFFGTRQWGLPDLAMAGLKDLKLAQETKETALDLLKKDPFLKNYPQLGKRLEKFQEGVHRE